MLLSLQNSKICHIASVLPSRQIDNMDLEFFSEKEKIKAIKTTGVKTRYELNYQNNESMLGLYLQGAKNVMETLHWDADSIDAVILVTQTPEYKAPATSCILQGMLGLKQECLCYDINMGCSGYIYGLFNAMSILQSGLKRVLLFAGDASSSVSYKKNKSSAFLFSDVGTCTGIEFQHNAPMTYFAFETVGKDFDKLITKHGGLAHPITQESFEEYIDEDGNINTLSCATMRGLDVFDFTMKTVPQSIQKMLQKLKINFDDIDVCYLHQASKLILEYMAQKLNITEKTPIHIQNFGNTSSASIPLLMCDNPNGSTPSQLSLLAGFGIGLSIGLCLIKHQEISTSIIYRN